MTPSLLDVPQLRQTVYLDRTISDRTGGRHFKEEIAGSIEELGRVVVLCERDSRTVFFDVFLANDGSIINCVWIYGQGFFLAEDLHPTNQPVQIRTIKKGNQDGY